MKLFIGDNFYFSVVDDLVKFRCKIVETTSKTRNPYKDPDEEEFIDSTSNIFSILSQNCSGIDEVFDYYSQCVEEFLSLEN